MGGILMFQVNLRTFLHVYMYMISHRVAKLEISKAMCFVLGWHQ